jgi:hypothetical protein
MDDNCHHYATGLEALLASIVSTMDAEQHKTFVRHLDQTLSKSTVGEEADEVIAGLVARVLIPGKASQ